MDKTSMDRIGTALADSIELGLSPTSAAKLINNAVGNPARALTIAITETSRVLNSAAITRYKDAGVGSMKWMTVLAVAGGSVACEICAPNNGVVVKVGESFPSGNMQPPAHPHCRCALLPDFSEYAEPNPSGVVTVPTPKPVVAFKPIELTDELTLNFARAAKNKQRSSLPVGSDPNLHTAQEMAGYNAKPNVLSAAEFDKIEGITVYRGVEKPSYIKAFYEGDNYAGQGVYGNGSYSTTSKGYALQFAAKNMNNVMELKITKDFNTVTVQEMNEWRKGFNAKIDFKIDSLRTQREKAFDLKDYKPEVARLDAELENYYLIRQRLGQDLGTLATLRGYDAIVVNAGEMGLAGRSDEIYYVILNRGKVVAKEMP